MSRVYFVCAKAKMNEAATNLLEKLRSAPWFSQAGIPAQFGLNTRSVATWEEALRCVEQPISWWCNVEAKKQLYEQLAKSHYDRFATWNDVARALLPPVKELISDVVVPSVPIAELNEKSVGWVQSQIIGGLLELSFRDCVDVTLFSEHLDIYIAGHFPCGWHVDSPSDFPNKALVMVL